MKTRLAAQIGTDRATRLYRAFVEDLRDRLAAIGGGIEAWWAFWPPDAPFAEIVAGPRVFSQAGPDLGARIHGAMEHAREGAERPVAVIGADAPHVPLASLRACRDALSCGADVVLGPALDGGYYLLGTRRPQPALFDDVAWGSDRVLETTRARVRERDLTLVELPPLADVDDVDGLEHLRAVLVRRPGLLPRTEAVLAADEP